MRSFSIFIQFWKNLFAQFLFLDDRAEPGEEVELEVGDLLLADGKERRDFFIRPAADDQQLDNLQLEPIPPLAPALDLLAQPLGERFFFQIAALAAADDAAR